MKKASGPKKKCDHEIILITTVGTPHIRACKKCMAYSPKPHPRIDHEEMLVLIDFVDFVAKQREERKAEQRKRLGLMEPRDIDLL